MKKFKQLKKQLMESELADGGALGQWPTYAPNSAHSDFGVHRIEAEEQIQRIQAFLNTFMKREFLEPRAALSLLRVKLNLTGLDFDFNNKTQVTSEKPMVFKLKRFGGTFGTTPDHDLSKGFKETDGVEDILGGDHLGLQISIKEGDSGLYNMSGLIFQYSGENPEASV